jgi:hypothetical protein
MGHFGFLNLATWDRLTVMVSQGCVTNNPRRGRLRLDGSEQRGGGGVSAFPETNTDTGLSGFRIA